MLPVPEFDVSGENAGGEGILLYEKEPSISILFLKALLEKSSQSPGHWRVTKGQGSLGQIGSLERISL